MFRAIADLSGRAVGATRGLSKIAAGQDPNGVFHLANFLQQFFGGGGGVSGEARGSGQQEHRADSVMENVRASSQAASRASRPPS